MTSSAPLPSRDALAACVGDDLAVDGVDALVLRLSAVTPLQRSGPWATFSAQLTGPADPLLAQQIVPLVHPSLGRFELFVVPSGRTDDLATYDVTFTIDFEEAS